MSDPIIANKEMPSVEYERYTTYWTKTLKELLVAIVIIITGTLIVARLFIIEPLRRDLQEYTKALRMAAKGVTYAGSGSVVRVRLGAARAVGDRSVADGAR